MKKHKYISGLLLFASFSYSSELPFTHEPHMHKNLKNDFLSANENIMTDMHNKMSTLKMTGDNDIDFLLLMIPHHQSGIEMAEEVLKSSNDRKVKNMALGIITEQRNEIEIMEKLIKEKMQ